jgi:hypothetical protein
MQHAVEATPDRPVLVDRFLEDATEVDVDCISDGETTVIGAIMEHIEEAGIHSGDSACVIPPFSLSKAMQDRIRDAAKKLAKAKTNKTANRFFLNMSILFYNRRTNCQKSCFIDFFFQMSQDIPAPPDIRFHVVQSRWSPITRGYQPLQTSEHIRGNEVSIPCASDLIFLRWKIGDLLFLKFSGAQHFNFRKKAFT